MATEYESTAFRRYAELLLRFRWLALVGILVVTGVFAWFMATRLTVDNSTEKLAAGSSEAADVLDRFQDDFGRDDLFYVLITGDVFTEDFLHRLEALHADLEGFDMELDDQPQADEPVEGLEAWGDDVGWGDAEGGVLIDEVTSLVDFRQTIDDDGAVRVVGFLDRSWGPADLPRLREEALADESMVGNILGTGGRHTVVSVRTRPLPEADSDRVAVALQELVAEHDAEGFDAQLTGTPAMNQALNALVVQDMNRLVTLAMLVMAGVLLVLFRSVIGVVPPLLVVAFASVWTLGAMAATGTPLTLLTNVLPAFIVVVGLGDAIHLLTVWRDERRRGVPNREAVLRSVGSTGLPITFTSLTTAAGLASFVLASSQATREVGLAGAFGVMVAWAVSLVFLPATLSFWNRGEAPADREARPRDFIDTFVQALNRASAGRGGRAAVLVAGAAIAAVSLWGVSLLQTHHDALEYFGEDSPVTVGIRTTDEHVGGTAAAHIVLNAGGDLGVRDLELLQGMRELEEHLMAYRQPGTGEAVVTNVASLLDVIRETQRALHRGDQAHYALPDSQRAVNDSLFVFENAGSEELYRIATPDYGRTHMTVRLKWMEADAYQPFSAHVQQGVERYIGDLARVETTGTIYNVLTVIDAMIGDLASSFAGALVAIAAMMLLLFRRVKLGLVALIPNLFPIAVLLGLMGLVGIPIDLNNILLASIVLGIAVDDTIHLMHQFRAAHDAGASVEGALGHAIEHAGRALVGTSIVLVLGFGVYLASSLISLQRFGLLVALACLVALLGDLLLVPALLRMVYGATTKGGTHDE